MITSALCNEVFYRCVKEFHDHNDVDHFCVPPYASGTMEDLLYRKNFIDTVQWHLEDIVRDPEIDPVQGIALKRRIDKSNQDRTDLVEKIDDHFLSFFGDMLTGEDIPLNTESPAWAVDRLSILVLKIWHMQEEVTRDSASPEHKLKCQVKLDVLLDQQIDLSQSIDQLLEDYKAGRKRMKVYRQMKMYNDPALNPVLYGSSK